MNKLQTQFDVSSLMVSDNTIQFDVHGFFDIKYAGNKTLKDSFGGANPVNWHHIS